MDKMDQYRQRSVNEISVITKLLLLLFCMVILLKKHLKNLDYSNNSIYLNLYNIVTLTIFIGGIYGLWAFISLKRFNMKTFKVIQYIENFMFVIIFIILIMYTGGNESHYKFIFLFIIIISTIQLGVKYGLCISIICSISILFIDLIWQPGIKINEDFENDLILSILFLLTTWILGYYRKMEKKYIEKLSYLANVDGLTGIYNHRYFYENLNRFIEYAKNSSTSVSLILMDIDFFKNYNDLYGHQKGDQVLRNIGKLLSDNIREDDMVSRYGGEEFAIILPKTEERQALILAENIRKKIEEFRFEGEENQPNGKITVSIGVSVFPYRARNQVELISNADDALYKAKFLNKNRVESYSSILEELKNDITNDEIEVISSIKTLIGVINSKDNYTYGHVERMIMYCGLLEEELNLNERDKKILKYAAYMHDVGKINISEELLNKKGKLTEEEFSIMKNHPINSAEIIKPIKSLKEIIPIILYHHEKYNGTGYPKKLKGEEIPYLARILAVINTFDVITTNRLYRNKSTYEDAVNRLNECKYSWFDPYIVDAFIRVLNNNKDKFQDLIK
ncbi:diguanylate cyclase [Clostridium rectalis]|uniref:bifunctional diguanylate cyclase/phosphohydrolase n=1 Tax=Clostridium rectalis TaxID=2040295 RepID=UPI003C12C55B